MHLSSIALSNLRQFEEETFEFSPGFNLLVGENGAGKTTIIRALLAALGGANQKGPYPKLEDEDIRLNREHADVEAEVVLSDKHQEIFRYTKELWTIGSRSHKRNERPLVLSYASNEATCASMNVKRAKRIRGRRDIDSRRDEKFLFYGRDRDPSIPKDGQSVRRFGDSDTVRKFLGKVLSTFSPDFQDFFWRFEPYDCSLVLPEAESKDVVFDKETEKLIRSAAMRFFQEDWPIRRKRPYEWPDQEKVTLYPQDDEERRRKRYLPRIGEVWKRMKLDLPGKAREALQNIPLEVKLTPRIMVRREIGILNLSQLSDGEQRLFSLFVDIARELTRWDGFDRNIGEGEAIVLIDEIDVHLHPKWQRQIVPLLEDLFPRCQFIATTHSPFVIQSARSDSNLVLLDGQPLAQLGNTGIEEIAQVVMDVKRPDVSTRYAQEVKLARSFLQLLDEAEKSPREKLDEYIERLGNKLAHAQNPALQAFLELQQESRLGG